MDFAPPQDELMEEQYEIVSDDVENEDEDDELMEGIDDEEEVEREPIWDVDYSFDSDDEEYLEPLSEIEETFLNCALLRLYRQKCSERIIRIVERREKEEVLRNMHLEESPIYIEELQPKTLHELAAFVNALKEANGGQLRKIIVPCFAVDTIVHLPQCESYDELMVALEKGEEYSFNEDDEESKEPMSEKEKKQLYFELALTSQWDAMHKIIEKRSNPPSEHFMKYEEWRELDTLTLRELKTFQKALRDMVNSILEKDENAADENERMQEMIDALEDKDYSFDSDDEDNQRPMNYIERMKLSQQWLDVRGNAPRTTSIIKTREGVDVHLYPEQVHNHMLQPKTLREIEAFFDSEQAKKGIVNSRELTREISTKTFTSEEKKIGFWDYFFDSDDEDNQEPMTEKESESLSLSYDFLPWQSIARAHHIIETRENIKVNLEKGFFPPRNAIPLYNNQSIAAFRNLQPKTQWELREYIDSESDKNDKSKRLRRRQAAGLLHSIPNKQKTKPWCGAPNHSTPHHLPVG